MLKRVIIFIFLVAYSLMSVHDIIPHHHHDEEDDAEHVHKHHENDHEDENNGLDDIIAFHEHCHSDTITFLADNNPETVYKSFILQPNFPDNGFTKKVFKVPLEPLYSGSKREFFPKNFYISFPLRAPPIV